MAAKRFNDLLRLAHSPWTDVTAGLVACGGANELPAVAGQLGDIALSGGVAPHGLIHRWRDESWRLGGQAERSE